MAEGPDRARRGEPRVAPLYGEAVRRFMLRPEATALAAVVVLFVVFTALSPDLFPAKLTYVSIMAVAAELGIVSIGVTLLMIGGHFDLSVGAVLGPHLLRRGGADARLRHAAHRGGTRGRRGRRRARRDQRADRRPVQDPLLRRDARHACWSGAAC